MQREAVLAANCARCRYFFYFFFNFRSGCKVQLCWKQSVRAAGTQFNCFAGTKGTLFKQEGSCVCMKLSALQLFFFCYYYFFFAAGRPLQL